MPIILFESVLFVEICRQLSALLRLHHWIRESGTKVNLTL